MMHGKRIVEAGPDETAVARTAVDEERYLTHAPSHRVMHCYGIPILEGNKPIIKILKQHGLKPRPEDLQKAKEWQAEMRKRN